MDILPNKVLREKERPFPKLLYAIITYTYSAHLCLSIYVCLNAPFLSNSNFLRCFLFFNYSLEVSLASNTSSKFIMKH
ncbi:hypothetical protein PHAVU_011G008900 [Phaseolus vulgaris]|uniref:Uncharacterized protein n=1 Tax=Phaseolus vulgaris TaxID=3885 RepID=V7AD27_PHAVU|nr:hypothetical protein PHAVU_011G008900g [Phaseolus vulgaris]ESW03374.1 hypothetical protein PHAVU_011G008900g [Phaseolus vulgaris]